MQKEGILYWKERPLRLSKEVSFHKMAGRVVLGLWCCCGQDPCLTLCYEEGFHWPTEILRNAPSARQRKGGTMRWHCTWTFQQKGRECPLELKIELSGGTENERVGQNDYAPSIQDGTTNWLQWNRVKAVDAIPHQNHHQNRCWNHQQALAPRLDMYRVPTMVFRRCL